MQMALDFNLQSKLEKCLLMGTRFSFPNSPSIMFYEGLCRSVILAP